MLMLIARTDHSVDIVYVVVWLIRIIDPTFKHAWVGLARTSSHDGVELFCKL